jgi:hypothetical protein
MAKSGAISAALAARGRNGEISRFISLTNAKKPVKEAAPSSAPQKEKVTAAALQRQEKRRALRQLTRAG